MTLNRLLVVLLAVGLARIAGQMIDAAIWLYL